VEPEQAVLGRCPHCARDLQGHGTRKRLARIGDIRWWCQARRFLCPGCKKTFTRLPDFLLPFKHYVALEIEAVLRHLFEGGRIVEAPSGADEGTLRRWWREFRYKLPQWAGALSSGSFELSHQVSGLVRQSHALKRLEEALSCLPALPSGWTVMIKALYWIKTSHPLCLLWPP